MAFPNVKKTDPILQRLGAIPYRLQLAGGWIDQPFVSRHNPKPPGSMVIVQIEPSFRPMDRFSTIAPAATKPASERKHLSRNDAAGKPPMNTDSKGYSGCSICVHLRPSVVSIE